MEKEFVVKAHDETCRIIGEAAYQLIAQKKPITNSSLEEMVKELSLGGLDLAEDLVLILLKDTKENFTEQAHAAVCQLFGEAVYQLTVEGRPVTNESLAAAIAELSTGGPDLAEDFALSLLRK